MLHVFPLHWRIHYIAYCAAFIGLFTLSKAQSEPITQDSLLFELGREALTKNKPTEEDSAYLRAADELARAKLFLDALALLPLGNSPVVADSNKSTQNVKPSRASNSLKPTWTIQAQAGFSENSDSSSYLFIDSASKSYNSLDTEVYNGELSATVLLEKITPSLRSISLQTEVSNARASASINWQLQSPLGHVVSTGTLGGTKNVNQPWKDSADNIRGSLEVTRVDTLCKKHLVLSLPIAANAVSTMFDRSGASSFQNIHISPSLSYLITPQSTIQFILSSAYTNYQGPDDSLDNVSAGPALHASYWGTNANLFFSSTALSTSCLSRDFLHTSFESENSLTASITTGTLLSLSCAILYTYTSRYYNDSIISTQDTIIRTDSSHIVNPADSLLYTKTLRTIKDSYTLVGHAFRCDPEFSLDLSDPLLLTFGCEFLIGNYPAVTTSDNGYTLYDSAMIWESGYTISPRAGISFTAPTIEISIDGSYRMDRPASSDSPLLSLSNTLGIQGALGYTLNRHIRADLLGSYSTEIGTTTTTKTSFFEISASISVKLP